MQFDGIVKTFSTNKNVRDTVSAMRRNKIIYSVNIEDVQSVAAQELGRELTTDELKIIADKIGDQFEWYEPIASVLSQYLTKPESEHEAD
jgi:hypothetical protein